MLSDAYRGLVEQLFASPLPLEFDELRAAYLEMGDAFPLPGDIRVEVRELAGVPCEWLSFANAPEGTILFLHGGGYCIGSPASHRHVAGEIARQTGTRVALLDYRLAPENPYPAGVDDATAAYLELARGAEPVAIAGDSAGAGLVMALLARLIERKERLPACVYCMSPWVDLTNKSNSRTLKAALDPVANDKLLNKMVTAYAGDQDPQDPRISPVFADFRGAPPVFIQAGTAEVLMDDAIALAQALADADVDVDLEIRGQMVHEWPWFFPAIPEGAEALGRACSFLSRHLRTS